MECVRGGLGCGVGVMLVRCLLFVWLVGWSFVAISAEMPDSICGLCEGIW